jgi:hypothetical protein
MKSLVGKRITKNFEFMGSEVEVKKLTVSEVMKIQEFSKQTLKSKSDSAQLDLLKKVIRIAVVGADELTDEDFNEFPLEALTSLSNNIMSFSGLGDNKTEGN